MKVCLQYLKVQIRITIYQNFRFTLLLFVLLGKKSKSTFSSQNKSLSETDVDFPFNNELHTDDDLFFHIPFSKTTIRELILICYF